MNVVMIPKKLAQKGDLVVIPRKEYEAFTQWKKVISIRAGEQWFWTPEWQKKEAEADEAIRRGKVSDAFSNHKELLKALKTKR
ncbi:MAG: AbrB/MazE/SpoVT family DNA-binding domain-containing protein [Candidatus Sungbacteria bacterium]|nr:AbrB/MazE/SpoVT family DNA-binding domain-containing protein [Candidatus Sungbacteria bacterium]